MMAGDVGDLTLAEGSAAHVVSLAWDEVGLLLTTLHQVQATLVISIQQILRRKSAIFYSVFPCNVFVVTVPRRTFLT